MSRPSIKQLKYFVAVARWGSFRRAAEELQTSQPTITAQIASAEKHLGVALFERGRAGAALSPAGRRLLPQARKVLEEMDSLAALASSAHEGAATYRLGVKSTLGPYLLPQLLPILQELHMDLKLQVREVLPVELEPQLIQGEFDMILSAYPPNSLDLTGEKLFLEDIRLVMPASHPLASRAVLAGEDLAGQKLLITEDGHFFTRLVEQAASRFGMEIQRDYLGSSLDALRSMVRLGSGIAFLPRLYIHSELEKDETLVHKEIQAESMTRTLGLIWRPNAPARAFYRRLASDIRYLLQRQLDGVVEVEETPL